MLVYRVEKMVNMEHDTQMIEKYVYDVRIKFVFTSTRIISHRPVSYLKKHLAMQESGKLNNQGRITGLLVLNKS